MNEPSVKRNYIYRLVYEVLAVITPFVTSPYVSRVLGADGIGIYSYTSSLMTYFTLFAALGTATYGAREIAQHRDNRAETSKLFWEIELMTVGTSLVCIVGWCIVIAVSENYRWYYVALLPTLLGTMFDISWFFTGLEQIKYIVMRNIVCKILGVLLLFVLVHQKSDLIIYVIINSMISLLGSLSVWTYIPRMIQKVDMSSLQFKRHFKETLVYFVPTIATSIYTVLDKTLIGVITNSTYENGYYEQTTKIINILKSVVFSAVNAVMGARISYLFSKNQIDEIQNRIKKSLNFIYFLAFGCVFGLIAIADNFVPWFFGDGYEPVILLLRIMAPIILIIGTSNCLGSQYYNPSGQRAKSAKFIILGSCVNLVLNLMLIPHYGAAGATIASVIAELSITFFYVKMSDGFINMDIIWKCSYKRIVAGIVMLVVVMQFKNVIALSLFGIVFLQVLVGVVVYLGLLWIMKDDMLFELIDISRTLIKKEGNN